MKNFRMTVWGMVLVACLFVFACRSAPDMVRVKMDYTPTNVVPPPKAFPESAIFLSPVADKRKNPNQIGENTETAKTVPATTDPAQVTAFLDSALKKEFKRAGFNLVDTQGAAKKTVAISLLNLWVEEKSVYNGSLVANVVVLDKSGKKLYDENVRALASRWGTSYNETQYQKVLSDTVVEFIKTLFSNDAFLKSLS
jgi:hypothetical protein